MKKALAIFDFDGTLTTKDTFLAFIKFHRGAVSFWWGFMKMSPVILLHLLRIIPNWKTKQYALTYFFGGERLEDFQEICDRFSTTHIPRLERKEALEKLALHQKEGHEIVVVSASAENWLAGWCKEKNVKLIATRLEVEKGCLTGKLIGNNCYGSEKLSRLEKEYNLSSFDEIHVYGDSRGDKEILAIATHPYYRIF